MGDSPPPDHAEVRNTSAILANTFFVCAQNPDRTSPEQNKAMRQKDQPKNSLNCNLCVCLMEKTSLYTLHETVAVAQHEPSA